MINAVAFSDPEVEPGLEYCYESFDCYGHKLFFKVSWVCDFCLDLMKCVDGKWDTGRKH